MPTPKRSITSRVAKQNPRPRKYATAAERQKALRERFPTLCVRVEQEQADFMKRIADEQGRTLQDVHLAFIKYANGRGNQWLTQGLKGFAPLPRFEEPPKENPMKRKPTPAQIAARERFAEMARSGVFKKKAKRNPAKKTVSRNPAPRGFVKADDYTIEVFNKYGMKPYDAVYMQTKGGRGEPTYDLTILKHENGKYLAAHGSVIVKQEFDRVGDAAAYLEEWYRVNRRPAATRTNPRASNPIILVSDKAIATKRKRNPINALSIKYACIMPEPGGMAYGIDERTPVTIRFSASELKRAYKCYLIPANVRESAGYKRLIAKQKEVYMSLAELKQLFRSFV